MSEPKDIEQLVEFRDKLLAWIQENEVEIEEDNCYPKEMIYVYDLKEYLGVKP